MRRQAIEVVDLTRDEETGARSKRRARANPDVIDLTAEKGEEDEEVEVLATAPCERCGKQQLVARLRAHQRSCAGRVPQERRASGRSPHAGKDSSKPRQHGGDADAEAEMQQCPWCHAFYSIPQLALHAPTCASLPPSWAQAQPCRW